MFLNGRRGDLDIRYMGYPSEHANPSHDGKMKKKDVHTETRYTDEGHEYVSAIHLCKKNSLVICYNYLTTQRPPPA